MKYLPIYLKLIVYVKVIYKIIGVCVCTYECALVYELMWKEGQKYISAVFVSILLFEMSLSLNQKLFA